MLNARFWLEGETLGMRAEGHADFAEKGKDTVCAGASALIMTMAEYLREMEAEGKLRAGASFEVHSGWADIAVRPKPRHHEEALIALRFAQTGMRLLQESYPGHVRVE